MENLNKAINILLAIREVSLSISEDLVFHIRRDMIENIRNHLQNNNVEINDLLSDDQIEIDKSFYLQYNIQPYKNFTSFFNRFELSDFGKRIIVILQENGSDMVIFSNNDDRPMSYFFQSGKQDFKAPNYYYLKKMIDVFFPKIVDYIDSIHKKYILLSPECGKFEIFEGNLFEIAEIEKPLENTYKAIEDVISRPKGWEIIIKNRIIRSLEIIEESEKRFYWLIIKLDQLIAITLKDYDVLVASHKHETILDKYEHEKDIFSDKIRSVLERVATNLLSIPITFSAALFGFREISEKWLINIFLVALAVFVCFSCIIQGLFIMELGIIKKEIYAKMDYFLKILSVFKENFYNISKPQLQKIVFLQILTCLMIIAFIILYCCLASNYIDLTPIKNLIKQTFGIIKGVDKTS